jgi:hypothetical protein
MNSKPNSYTVMWTSERCQWLVKTGELGKPDGRLTHSVSISGGVYRLSPDSASEFERLIYRADR